MHIVSVHKICVLIMELWRAKVHIVLSVLLRFTASDNPFSIFNLFLNWNDTRTLQVTGLCKNSYLINTILYLCSRTFVCSVVLFSFGHCICLSFFDLRLLLITLWYIQTFLRWIFIVWAHWSNSSRVDIIPFGHILIRSQPVFALTPYCCLETTVCMRGDHSNDNTTDVDWLYLI